MAERTCRNSVHNQVREKGGGKRFLHSAKGSSRNCIIEVVMVLKILFLSAINMERNASRQCSNLKG